jgi:GNAT superfamily N-acetyltransferase
MNITIRDLKIEDYSQFTKLISTNISFKEYKYFLYDVLSNKHIILVALIDNNIVGTGTLLIESKLSHNLTYMGHIENLFILEEYRGKGIGKQIMEILIDYAKNFGCYRIDLICKDELLNFYKNIGFKIKQLGMTMLIEKNFK